jgi:hypothetical protein
MTVAMVMLLRETCYVHVLLYSAAWLLCTQYKIICQIAVQYSVVKAKTGNDTNFLLRDINVIFCTALWEHPLFLTCSRVITF